MNNSNYSEILGKDKFKEHRTKKEPVFERKYYNFWNYTWQQAKKMILESLSNSIGNFMCCTTNFWVFQSF